MNRLSFVLVGLALVAASCASATTEITAEPEASVAEVTSTTVPPATTSTSTTAAASSSESRTDRSDFASTTTTTAQTTTTEAGPPPEGSPAPDFTLALGEDGSESFTLSDEAKPVFMVFWAEW
jgi:cytoskeletal protein RodZ